MTIKEAFRKFRDKSEHNGLNLGVASDKGRFVRKFNEAYNRLIEYTLDKRNQDDLLLIQHLLVDDKQLKESSKHLDHVDYVLPLDYFDYSSAYVNGSKDKCESKKIELFIIKDDNRPEVLSDEYNKPSFLWREAPITLSDNKVKVYTQQEFTPNSLYLSYYRYPLQIGLVDENNPESDFKSINPEGTDKLIDRVISVAVGELDLETNNPRFQLNKGNAISKI